MHFSENVSKCAVEYPAHRLFRRQQNMSQTHHITSFRNNKFIITSIDDIARYVTSNTRNWREAKWQDHLQTI